MTGNSNGKTGHTPHDNKLGGNGDRSEPWLEGRQRRACRPVLGVSQLLEGFRLQTWSSGSQRQWISSGKKLSRRSAEDSPLQLEPGVSVTLGWDEAPACSHRLNLGGWSCGNHSVQEFREAEGWWAWQFLVGRLSSYK